MMIEITTPRFTLRPLKPEDASRIADLCNDQSIARNTARIIHPYTRKDAESFVAYAIEATRKGGEYPFAVCRNGTIIACAGVKPHGDKACELGYWVGADSRGQGVATEAGDAMLQFARAKLKPALLTSGHFIDNLASGRVLAKLGFRPAGETETMHSAGRGTDVETVRLAMCPGAFKPIFKADISQ